MDILDGAILWSTLGVKSTNGNYCIFILRASTICMVPMDLWTEKGHYYLLVHFYGGIDILSYDKNNTFFSQLVNLK